MFIISKLLLFLLFPFTWIVVLLIWALITKSYKKKQKLLIIDVILLYIFSIPLLLNAYQNWWDYRPAKLNITSAYSCAIILGGYASEFGKTGTGYFNGSADRFIQGTELYTTGKTSHILLTGGNASINPDGFRESTWIDGELKKLHVPDSAIFIENQSRNTIENASFSKKLLEAKHLTPPYLLITSAFHMRRALLIFQKSNIKVIPYPAAFAGDGNSVSLDSFVPSSGALSGWEIYTKELVGYVTASLHKY